MEKKLNAGRAVQLVILVLLGITMLFPFIWMISTSLKTFDQIFTVTPTLIPRPLIWERYINVWKDTHLLSGFKNSFLVAVPVIVVGTFTSSLAAYAFAKMKLPHSEGLFMALLSTMMIPFAAVMIPQFVMFTRLHWTDTLLPLIIPGLFGNVGMIFFLRQFMAGIPDELFEAGKIDGCSSFALFSKIMFPVIKPALAVQVLMWFMGLWNDFLGPVIYLNTPEKMTVQAVIGMLKSQFVSQTDMGLIMTASVIAVLPIIILFLIFQKYLVDTMVLTGIKG